MALAIILSFLAALGFASGSICIRVGTQRISAPTATSFSVTTSALVASIAALSTHSGDMLDLSWKAYAWFVLMGAMSYPGARVLGNTAIKMIGASRAAPFNSLQPVFAFILGMAALGERPDLLVVLGTPAIVCGLILVMTSRSNSSADGQVASKNSLGYLMATAAAGAFGSRDVISRHVVSGLAPPSVTAAYSLSMGAVMLFTVTGKDLVRSIRTVPPRYAALCCLAGVTQGLALVSLFEALGRAPVTVVSPINASSALITVILAHFFLQRLEAVNFLLLVGTTLSVSGVTLVVLGAAS